MDHYTTLQSKKSELNVFRNIIFFGEIFDNWPKDLFPTIQNFWILLIIIEPKKKVILFPEIGRVKKFLSPTHLHKSTLYENKGSNYRIVIREILRIVHFSQYSFSHGPRKASYFRHVLSPKPRKISTLLSCG